MRRAGLTILVLVPILAGMIFCCETTSAQERGNAEQAAKNAAAEAKQENIYRLEYTMHEVETGKRTNSRTYTFMVSAGEKGGFFGGTYGFRVGSKIPVSMGTGPGAFQYQDLGVKIDARIHERESKVLIESTIQIDSVGVSNEPISVPSTPVIRTVSLRDTTQAVPGKAALVGSLDDVTPNRRYEIDVMVKKVE